MDNNDTSTPESSTDAVSTSAPESAPASAGDAAWSWDAWDGNLDALPAEHKPVWDAAFGYARNSFATELEELRNIYELYKQPPAPAPPEKKIDDFEEWKEAQRELEMLRGRTQEYAPQLTQYQQQLADYEAQLQELRWLDGYRHSQMEGWADDQMSRHPQLHDPDHPDTRFFIDALKDGRDPDAAIQLVGKPREAQEFYLLETHRGVPERLAVERALRMRTGAKLPSRGVEGAQRASGVVPPPPIERLPLRDAIKEAVRQTKK